MKKYESKEYYNFLESHMTQDDKVKMTFIKKFLMDELEVESDEVRITLTNVHFRVLEYVILSILLEYEEYTSNLPIT